MATGGRDRTRLAFEGGPELDCPLEGGGKLDGPLHCREKESFTGHKRKGLPPLEWKT